MHLLTSGVRQFPRALATGLAFATLPAIAADPPGSPNSPEGRTMETMRVLAGALLSRELDEVSAELRVDGPRSGWVLASQKAALVHMPSKSGRLSPSELLDLLQPFENLIYLCDIPERDAWGERLEVYYEQEKLLSAEGALTLRSAGANRRFDSDVYEVGGFLPGSSNDDLVIHAHRFVRWPIGIAESELRVEPKVGSCADAEGR